MMKPKPGAISSKKVDKKPFNFKKRRMHTSINLTKKKRMLTHSSSSNSNKDSILTLIMKEILKISQKILNQMVSMLRTVKSMKQRWLLRRQISHNQ